MMQALSQHQIEIARAAGDQVSPKEKLDVTASTFLAVLNEALSIGPVKKSGRHIDQFSKTNKENLDKIFKDIGSWIGGMSKGEKQLFYLGLATKPYTLELIKTIPRVERKISRKIATYRFFGKLLNIVKL